MGGSKNNNFRVKTIALLVAGSVAGVQPAYAAQDDCQGNAKTFATLIGGFAGAVIGNEIGDGKAGAVLVGAALGGLLGNYIGSEIDRRHCELEKIAKANGLDYEKPQTVDIRDSTGITIPGAAPEQVKPGTTVQVDISTWKGMEHFSSGADALTPKAQDYFSAVARQYSALRAADATVAAKERESGGRLSDKDKQQLREKLIAEFNQRPIVLVGHTDDTGDSRSNQKLSEQRAQTVAILFKAQGIPASRIYFRGAGDVDPVADNRTEAGRASNRRVEVIELESREKLETFVAIKKSNPDFLRPKGDIENTVSVEAELTKSSASTSQSEKTAVHKVQSAGKEVVPVVATSNPSGKGATKSDQMPATVVLADYSSNALDFGGMPSSGKIAPEVLQTMGPAIKPEKSLSASLGSFFVKEAHAAADDKIYNLPCTADAPRYGGQYVSLETGKAITAKTADYAPGLYQTTWVGTVNGHYIGVTPIGVLRASYQAVSQPTAFVYADTAMPDRNARATLKVPMQVNAYPGKNGILYRMYATGKSNLVCADIVLPHRAPFTVAAGKIYHKHRGVVYENSYEPEMLVASNIR